MTWLWAFALAHAGPTWELAYADQVRIGYVAPARDTRSALRGLVRALAEAAPSGTLPEGSAERAALVGFQLDVHDDVAWLSDAWGRGAGVLALRLGPLREDLVLQAPHPTSDENTGAVVSAMFDEGDVRAACVATVYRHAGPGADPADSTRSWLSVMTQGLADALARPVFVQLHGFEAETSDADAVLSTGADPVDGATMQAALRTVATALDAVDVRTGDDVPDLAAHTNAQGRLLARRHARFWHLELSAPIRAGLRHSAASRRALRDALLVIAGGA